MKDNNVILPTDEQINFFHENGYLLINNALSAGKVSQLLDAANKQMENNDKSQDIRYRNVVSKNDEFLSLLNYPSTFPFVLKFMQHYNIQLASSRLIYTAPNNVKKRALGWHIDGAFAQPKTYAGDRVMQYLKVGYFLTDLTSDGMGNLVLLPKSHRDKSIRPPDEAMRSDVFQGNIKGAISIKAPAGTAIIFSQNTFHGTDFNRSNNPRIALYFAYNYAYMRPVDYSVADELYAKCTDVQCQLLGKRCDDSMFAYYLENQRQEPIKQKYIEWFGSTWFKSH